MKTENGPLNNLTSNGEFRKDTEVNKFDVKSVPYMFLKTGKRKVNETLTKEIQVLYSSTAACGRKFSTLGSQRSD